MKKVSQLLVLAVLGSSVAAQAGPAGPSARMAAWLKKHPGSKWLAHYLPDDRYKIAGGVWKYVSTDLDTFYHRPDSPLMLRQSADHVIGFANAEDAEEAGYKAAPDAMGFAGTSVPFNVGGVISPVGGQRVVLGDGVSTIVLPRGWRLVKSPGGNVQGGTLSADLLVGPQNTGIVAITYTVPPGTVNQDLGKIFKVRYIKQLSANMGKILNVFRNNSNSSAGGVSLGNAARDFATFQKNQKITSITLGGIEGVSIYNPNPGVATATRRQFTFGRGQKMWVLSEGLAAKADTSAVMKTFVPR